MRLSVTRLSRIFCLAVLTAALLLPFFNTGTALADPAWYNSAWQYRKALTIDNTKVPSTQSNFPVLVSVTDTDLRDDAQGSGNDILFTAADGVTKLSHEIESYNGGTGTLAAWVKVTSLSGSADTVIYMYYGNGSVGNQEYPTDVWSNGYEAVYHLHDDFFDSTANHHATNSGSVDTIGQIADGQNFTPASEIQAGSWSVSGSAITVQSWLYPDDFDQDDPRIMSKATAGGTQDHVYMLGLGGSGERYVRGRIKTGTSDTSGTTTLESSTNPAVVSTWQLVTLTYDGSNMRLYRNGSQVASTGKSGNLRVNSWDIAIGNNPGNSNTGWASLDGKLDEVRVSSAARSADWLTTEYNNQYSPSTFFGVGTEEVCPDPPPPVAVGGTVFPVNKTQVLLPWIVLFVVVSLVGGGVAVGVKRRIWIR